jgi:hypothetical protein
MEYQDTNIQVHTYFGRSWCGNPMAVHFVFITTYAISAYHHYR